MCAYLFVCSSTEMSWPAGSTGLDALLRQLQQSLAAQTGATGPPQMTPQSSSTPSPTDASNLMQMLMARAVSVPLASVLYQLLMGSAQQPPAQSAYQSPPLFSQSLPAPQVLSPLLQPALLQMMQQIVTATPPAPSPQVSVAAPAAPQQITIPPVASPHLPSPASVSPRSSRSPSIQLPPIDPAVAKDLLRQLVQQLQQAGQLPYDTIQHLLQPNISDTTTVQIKNEAVQQLSLIHI